MDEEDAALEAETAAAAEKSAEKIPAAAVVDLTLDSDAADNTSRLKARATTHSVWSRSLKVFYPERHISSFELPKNAFYKKADF